MHRGIAVASVALVLAMALTGCEQTADESASQVTASSPVATATTTASPSQSPAATGAGCQGTATLPAGAVAKTTGDVDGDGKPDRLFDVTTGGRLRWGVLTAAGALAQFTDPLAGPDVHRMWVSTIRGTTLAVLSDGREAVAGVYSSCGLRPVTTATRSVLMFDMQDLRGTGTGVGCEQIDGTTRFGSYLAVPANGGYRVTFTPVTVSSRTTVAKSGSPVVLGTSASPDSALVQRATTSSCGDAVVLTGPQ